MFNYISNMLNPHLKFHRFYTYNYKFYSVLSCNKSFCILKKKNQQKKIEPIQGHQFRFSSQNTEKINLPFYDTITTSELSLSLRNALAEIHDDLNIPWWGCIVLTTLLYKFLCTLIFGLYQLHVSSKIKLSKIELNNNISKSVYLKTIEIAQKQQWSPEKQMRYFKLEMHKAWKDLVIKNNCHPFKLVILSWFQIPGLILITLNLKKLTEEAPLSVMVQLSKEGPFWSPNLLLPDSSLICSTIIGLCNLSVVEMNNLLILGQNQTLNHKISKNFMRLFSIFAFVISLFTPSALSFYWAITTLYSLLQFLLFLSPRVNRFCGIPQTPLDNNKPYSLIYSNFKKKFQKTK